MADFSEMANKLQKEVVADMAESYFGDRKQLDDMIEAFDGMVREMRDILSLLYMDASRLFRLLLDTPNVLAFGEALDISFDGLPLADDQPCTVPEPLPFAFTTIGRYEKCLQYAYQALRERINEYNYGRYYDEDGRKRLTMHYARLEAVAGIINDKINHANEGLSPSGTLRYVKKMDTVQSERESVMGEACLVDGCSLDQDLKFTPIDFSGLGFPVLSDLPPLKEVKPAIKAFCNKIDPSRKQEIKDVMESLRDGSLIC